MSNHTLLVRVNCLRAARTTVRFLNVLIAEARLKTRLRKNAVPSRKLPVKSLPGKPRGKRKSPKKRVAPQERVRAARKLILDNYGVEAGTANDHVDTIETTKAVDFLEFENTAHFPASNDNDVEMHETPSILQSMHRESTVNEADRTPTSQSSPLNALVTNDSDDERNEIAEVLLSLGISRDSTESRNASITRVPRFRIFDSLQTEKQLTSWTGINSFQLFDNVCQATEYYLVNRMKKENTKYSIDVHERVLMTLMILKLDLTFEAAAPFFHVSRWTAARSFKEIILALEAILSPLIQWQSKESIQKNFPRAFQRHPATRVVLDGTEIKTTTPKCLRCNIQTYSSYKSMHTLKIMFGIAPDGIITYVSKVYGGRASDKVIFAESDLPTLCEEGDGVMVDKGYEIDEECARYKLKLFRPKKKRPGQKQFPHLVVEESRHIASARVHIERLIERVKNFKILKGTFQWHMFPYVQPIMHVIAGLVNLSGPLLAEDKF